MSEPIGNYDFASRYGVPLLLLFPGVMTVYLSFNSGGVFESTTAFATLIVFAVGLVAIAVTREPLGGLAPRGLIAIGLLTALAIWTLLSSQWSDATGRSLIAYDRILLYLAVLALFACLRRSTDRFRWLLRGLLVACAGVALAGLTSRLLPGAWHTAPGLVSDRLSFPLTYWNTFALLVGIGCILAVHHSSDEHEPPAVRIAAAALLPLLSATLLLTFSRGALAVAILGTLAYLLIARPRGLVGAALAGAATLPIALSQVYSAELIHEGIPLTPAAVDQSHYVLLVLALCAGAAAVIRALGLRLDDRVAAISFSATSRRRMRIGAALLGVLVLIAFVVGGGPGAIDHQYEKFVNNTHEDSGDGQRDRLLGIGNDGRVPLWNVAREAYASDPLKGVGAGTYQLWWQKHRDESHERVYAYSLYFEFLGELGLVGIFLLAGILLVILTGLALCLRGPGRPVYAAGLAVFLAWIVHAGIDIDWQTPAVSVPIFALGGLALSRPLSYLDKSAARSTWLQRLAGLSAGGLRPALAIGCVLLAVIPTQVALGQTDLRESIDALSAGNCVKAQRAAQDATSEINIGPRPYEVLAMCAARRKEGKTAVNWAKRAVKQDGDSWETHFVLALAQGTAGIDPRPETRIAREANPRAYLPQTALAAFGDSPQQWRATARVLPFAMW